MIVVPNSLQMGWGKSPGLFCNATKTACKVAQELLDDLQQHLPHPLENLYLLASLPSTSTHSLLTSQPLQLLEVYIDDFLALAQIQSQQQLLHFTYAVLHGIH